MVPGFPGSSPLTRGKRVPRYRRDRDGGLIPAHAGKTSRQKRSPHGDRAHPRSRGENRPISSQAPSATGSSPLTRGKLMGYLSPIEDARLIPAHAGKTARGPGGAALGAAHPRSRGENARLGGPITSGPGSSPLTRGKRLVGTDRFFRSGLIPAHAGKTLIRTQRPNTAVAHPRSRGENAPSSTIWTMLAGSSPLTRGKRPAYRCCPATSRLIPAHAGKTTVAHC